MTVGPLVPDLLGSPLEPRDYARLEARWINRELADMAMLRRVDSLTGAQIVGRNGNGDYAGILIPYIWPGEDWVRDYRLRRDHPDLERTSDGTLKERAKYLSPPGRQGMLYFAPGTAAELLTNVDVPIVITEGELKTLALSRLAWYFRSDASENPCFLPVGIAGVWNWRGIIEKTYNADGVRVAVKGPIPDLARIPWQGRRVVIFFDADVDQKPDVAVARDQLTRELQSRGAEVAWFVWPKGVPRHLKGVDDYLAACGPAEVLPLIVKARVVANKKKRDPLVETQSDGSSHDWRMGLLIGRNGDPKILLANAITALRRAREWTGVLAYDEFARRPVMQKPAPWPGADPTVPWSDNDDRLATDWLQRQGIGVPLEVAGQAIQTVAMDHPFHPVRDYLDSLQWDGIPRLDRFWPVRCNQIDIASLQRDRDQLWAEARDRFRNGEVWWLDTPELEAEAREEQADRYQGDPWDDRIAQFVADKLTVSVPQILEYALNKKPENWTQADANRVARSLLRQGWERFRSSEPGRPWLYRRKKGVPVRPSAEEPTEPS